MKNYLNNITGLQYFTALFILAIGSRLLVELAPIAALLLVPGYIAVTYARAKKLNDVGLFWLYTGCAVGVFVLPMLAALFMLVNGILVIYFISKNAPKPAIK